MSKRTTISLIGAAVAIVSAVVLASSRSAADDGLPKGELSLPHFWVMSIGDAISAFASGATLATTKDEDG